MNPEKLELHLVAKNKFGKWNQLEYLCCNLNLANTGYLQKRILEMFESDNKMINSLMYPTPGIENSYTNSIVV